MDANKAWGSIVVAQGTHRRSAAGSRSGTSWVIS